MLVVKYKLLKYADYEEKSQAKKLNFVLRFEVGFYKTLLFLKVKSASDHFSDFGQQAIDNTLLTIGHFNPYLFQGEQRYSQSADVAYERAAHFEKLAESMGFIKSEPKWNTRYFVLEENILKWYQDDEKLGKMKFIEVDHINTVKLISNHKKRANVCLVSLNDKFLKNLSHSLDFVS